MMKLFVDQTEQFTNPEQQIVNLVMMTNTSKVQHVYQHAHVVNSQMKVITHVMIVTMIVNVAQEMVTTNVLVVMQEHIYITRNVFKLVQMALTQMVPTKLVKNVAELVRHAVEQKRTNVIVATNLNTIIIKNVINHAQLEHIQLKKNQNPVKYVMIDVVPVKILHLAAVLPVNHHMSFKARNV